MHPTKLLIFGNPKGGTPLMLAAPSIAIDLPLKILIWEDDQGKVWVSYNSPEYLAERHRLPESAQNIAFVATWPPPSRSDLECRLMLNPHSRSGRRAGSGGGLFQSRHRPGPSAGGSGGLPSTRSLF